MRKIVILIKITVTKYIKKMLFNSQRNEAQLFVKSSMASKLESNDLIDQWYSSFLYNN